jgi:hypothetical protein
VNRVNEVSRKEELEGMKRNDLMATLKKYKEEGKELPEDWSKLKNEELIQTILEIEGENVEQAVKSNEITRENPFGEEIIKTVIPVDQLNPKKKTIQVTVNFKPLLFPIGKTAFMPKSYYDAFMHSLNEDTKTSMKMQENRMKEI